MLSELLSRRDRDDGGRPAVIAGGESVTWSELSLEVSRLAAGLSAQSVGPGDAVAIQLPNGVRFVAAFLALARLGAKATLLSVDLKPAEIAAAECRTLLDAQSLASFVAADGTFRGTVCEDFDADFLQLPTSGTTGPPKLVLRSQAHLGALAAAYCATAGVTARDRLLCMAPLSHGIGLCSGLLASLHSGATLFVRPGFDRRQTLRSLGGDGITIATAVPFMFSVLADTPLRESFRAPSLRLAFTGGAPLYRDVWSKVRERLGISLRQMYGSSETGVVTMNMDDDPESSAETVGRPVAGVEVSIRGEDGEIAVRTPAARAGWIHTGDLGTLDDRGRLFITGRRSHFLNIAGRKVNPAEVENVLLGHPLVRDAAVVALRNGSGEEAAKAIVVCSEPCRLEELVAFCRERLADYKVPRIIELRDSLPRSAAGKVLSG